VSRDSLSKACSLSIATTKRLVDELISRGMVEEAGAEARPRARGRRPTVLRLGPGYGYAVGIEVEPSALQVTGIDFSGQQVLGREVRTTATDRETLEQLLVNELRAAVDACAARGSGPLLGVGAGIAGLVDAREGVVLYCPGLQGWENVDLAARLRREFSAPVIVDDGVRCMALAEKRLGLARGLDTFLFVYIGRGVGSGIVLDNRIYRGANGICGEFGHITVRENGPLCVCGNRGCLEAVASTSAILARVRDLLAANVHSALQGAGPALGLAELSAAARSGDKVASMVIAETEESIGIGVADLINVFDPGTVILAGEVVASLHGLMLDGIQRIVRRRAIHSISQRTRILASAFDADSAALGAATMAIERLLGTEILNL
jgi:predicted NBD/HSP70 family sugar kinase